MSSRPSSVVAERAVRYLHSSGHPATSVHLARELLSLTVADEEQATRVLGAAFADDPRLSYDDGAWHPIARKQGPTAETAPYLPPEPDLAFVLVDGTRENQHAPFTLTSVAASRRRGEDIIAACASDPVTLMPGTELKAELRGLLAGAQIVLYTPPGGLAALESWLDEPVLDPLPLALLARRRLHRPALRDLEEIAAALSLSTFVSDDPANRIELLPACFDALRPPGAGTDDHQQTDADRHANAGSQNVAVGHELSPFATGL